MNFVKLVNENIKLRRRANTFESKYNAVNEELLTLYRNKSNVIDERDRFKAMISKIKEENKKLRKQKMDLEMELKEDNDALEKEITKNRKMTKELKKYMKKLEGQASDDKKIQASKRV